MQNKLSEQILNEFLPQYQTSVKNFSSAQFKKFINRELLNAHKNYNKLKRPKTWDLNIYISFWVREEVERDLAKKTLKKIDKNSRDAFAKAWMDYDRIFPYTLIPNYVKRLHAVPIKERDKVWRNLGINSGYKKKIEDKFKKFALARNNPLNLRNHSSFIGMALENSKIPKENYRQFIKSIDEIAARCMHKLPETDNLPFDIYSRFNKPCFICIPGLNTYKNYDEVIDLMCKKFAILKKFKHKIQVTDWNQSRMKYVKETDCFEIYVNNINNLRHRTLDLLHELCHVVCYLKKGKNYLISGKYQSEKDAAAIEIPTLKGISHQLFQAYVGGFLSNLWTVLFEIKLYTDPNRDLSKLYAECFNRCYKQGRQRSNPMYLLDEDILLRPLRSLPHAVAQAEVLRNFI